MAMEDSMDSEEQTIREAATMAADVTPWAYGDWYPVMHRWWAAGHDLAHVVAWVESQQVSPAYADMALPLANAAKVKAEEFEQAMARVTETIHGSAARLDDDRTDDE